MKNKLLLKAMAVVMSAVCLTGCSQMSAAGSGEAKNKVVFSSEQIANVAKKYGMQETETYSECVQQLTKDENHSLYYVMNNSEEANKWYYASYLVAENSPFPEIKVNECLICFEKISEGMDGRNALTEIYMFNAADDQSALDLFNAFCVEDSKYENSSGEKDGYKYSIRYLGNENRQMTGGVYLQNSTVIFINYAGEVEEDGGCVGFFCKELGLESPLTLKK